MKVIDDEYGNRLYLHDCHWTDIIIDRVMRRKRKRERERQLAEKADAEPVVVKLAGKGQ